MADKTISSLPAATTVDDSSLWVAENQGQAQKVTGAQIKGFARESVQQYVSQAQQAAQEAQEAVTQIGTAVDDTEANAQAAQAAQTSAESARDEAIEASQGVSAHVTQAQQAASQATQSASDAQISASTAETYSDSAEIAKTAAETAKSIAETARDNAEAASASAEGYSSTAQTSASQASQSAQTAQSAQSAAETAKTGAESARHAIENMMVEAITLATGQPATVSKSLVDQVVKLTFGLPTGAKGDPGDKGDTGTGIQSIELTGGTHAPGTTDTYTITLSDDSTFQFTVYNGANGTGAGDFMADGSVPMTGNLDMNGNRVTEVGSPTADTDAANKGYVDEAVSNMEITTDTTPTQGSTNPVQSGGVYTALSKKQDTITGQQGQVVGFDASGKPVAQAAPDTGVISFNGRNGAVYPGADDYSADMIKFSDGQTFQDKYDSGQLTGPAGANGTRGPQGEPGESPYDVAVAQGYTGTEAEFYAALVSLKDAPFLPLSGGTMDESGYVKFGSNGTRIEFYNGQVLGLYAHPSQSGYVSAIEMGEGVIVFTAVGGFVNFSNAIIKGLGAPQADTDAATKGYVDTAISSSITSALEASY